MMNAVWRLGIVFHAGGFLHKISVMNRSGRRISKALVAAFAVSGIAIWQIGVCSRGGWLSGGEKAQGKGAPVTAPGMETKFHRRDRPGTDPEAAYIAQAKRGMTEREVRWIVSDFEAIGTRPASGKAGDLRAFWERQNEWYLAALSEALSLTSAQKREVRASLKGSLDQTMDKFAKSKVGSTVPSVGMYAGIYFEAKQCMRAVEFAPWNLCELSEAQSALTLEAEWRNEAKATQNIQSGFNLDRTWFARLSVSMKEPAFGSLISYEPGSTMNIPSFMPGITPGGIIDISTTFPLTPDQKLADHLNDVVAQAKILHPAQLRLGLLLNSSLAGSISREMDRLAPGE